MASQLKLFRRGRFLAVRPKKSRIANGHTPAAANSIMSRGKPASLPYTAAPRDSSLESYMIEALYLLELRFECFDGDGAGCVFLNFPGSEVCNLIFFARNSAIQYNELIRGLATTGFRKGDELQACFERVDVDRSGRLDFSEVSPSSIVLVTSTSVGSYYFKTVFRSHLHVGRRQRRRHASFLLQSSEPGRGAAEHVHAGQGHEAV